MPSKKLTSKTTKPETVLKDLELSCARGKAAMKDPKGGASIKIPAKKVAKFR